jgi:flagellar hook-length control protein FliK
MNVSKPTVSNPADALRAPATTSGRPDGAQSAGGDESTSSFGAQLARAGTASGHAAAGSTPESAPPAPGAAAPVAATNAKATPAAPGGAQPAGDDTGTGLQDDGSAAHGFIQALDAAALQVSGAGSKRIDGTASAIARQKISAANLASQSLAANAKGKAADAAPAQSAATTATPSCVAKVTQAGTTDAPDATPAASPGANPDANASPLALVASLPQIAATAAPATAHSGAAASPQAPGRALPTGVMGASTGRVAAASSAPARSTDVPSPAIEGLQTEAAAQFAASSDPDGRVVGRDSVSQDGGQPLSATLDPTKALAAAAAERSGAASPRVPGAPAAGTHDAAQTQIQVPTPASMAAPQALAGRGAPAANAIASALQGALGKDAEAAMPAGAAPASPETGMNFAQVAQLAAAPGPVNAPGAAPAMGQVASTPGSANFAPDLAHQVVSMVKTGAQSVQLSLTPAELGPVSVSIQMSGTAASVVFSASHPATRAALQDALPHLSNLFSQSGLQLSGALVGDGSQQQAQSGGWSRPERSSPDFGANPSRFSGTDEPDSAAAPARSAPGPHRLVDTFV